VEITQGRISSIARPPPPATLGTPHLSRSLIGIGRIEHTTTSPSYAGYSSPVPILIGIGRIEHTTTSPSYAGYSSLAGGELFMNHSEII